MNIDKLDKILLSNEDVDSLFKWRDNHLDYVHNFKPVLKEGCIILTMKDNKEEYHREIFRDNGDNYYHYMIFVKGLKVHEMLWDKTTKIGTVLFTKMQFPNGGEHDYNNTVLSLHASLMAYMEYYSDKKEYVEVEHVTSTKTKKSKGGKGKKSPIKIRKKVYKVKITEESIKMDKRRYERKTEGWNVKGFWKNQPYGKGRKLRKRIWVESYPKGDKKNITPKEYKL